MSCCTNPRIVETNTDMVCTSCGVVSVNVVEAEAPTQLSKVIPCDESRIGSKDISPSSILHSKKHRNILESRVNPYEKKLFDTCNALKIPSNGIRRATYLFQTIRNTKKIPLGNNAFFCIWQTCRENEIDLEEEKISATVRECFALKRPIRTKKAIFLAQSILLDCEKEIHLEKPKVERNPLKEIKPSLRKGTMGLSADCASTLRASVDVVALLDVA